MFLLFWQMRTNAQRSSTVRMAAVTTCVTTRSDRSTVRAGTASNWTPSTLQDLPAKVSNIYGEIENSNFLHYYFFFLSVLCIEAEELVMHQILVILVYPGVYGVWVLHFASHGDERSYTTKSMFLQHLYWESMCRCQKRKVFRLITWKSIQETNLGGKVGWKSEFILTSALTDLEGFTWRPQSP